jgi:hypothetical protein
MTDFHVRADSVNVEQIMEQIRARIREKRGVDYTEQQIRDLAAVKLEKFLDPRGVRSDLLERFRQIQLPARAPRPKYSFEDETLFETHRAPLRWIRRLLRPVLKLFFNPNPLIHVLHLQADLNAMNESRELEQEKVRHDIDQLHYEVMHNLVVELTRTGIEVKNLKMRVESLASRLEFNERRARALESAVVYKPAAAVESPEAGRSGARPRICEPDVAQEAQREPATAVSGAQPAPPAEGPGQRSRRRRRRRGRRGGARAAAVMGAESAASDQPSADGGEIVADQEEQIEQGADDITNDAPATTADEGRGTAGDWSRQESSREGPAPERGPDRPDGTDDDK